MINTIKEIISKHRSLRRVSKLTDVELDKAVKIAGTEFDRKRKLTDADIDLASMMRQEGHSWSYIGEHFNVDPRTIRYHLDSAFRQSRIDCSKKYTYTYGSDYYNIMIPNRVAYKRDLVVSGKIILD